MTDENGDERRAAPKIYRLDRSVPASRVVSHHSANSQVPSLGLGNLAFRRQLDQQARSLNQMENRPGRRQTGTNNAWRLRVGIGETALA